MKLGFFVVAMLMLINISAQTNFTKYNEEAYYSFQQNDIATAIKKFSKALDYKNEVSNSYKVADTYINRGACKQLLQKYESAQSDFDEALKIKPEYVKVYQIKASAYLGAEQYQKAIDCADKGLEIKENDADLKAKKAEAYTQLKKYDDAIHTLLSVLEDNPKNKNATKYIGHNYQMKKKWDSALVYFSAAIQLDPLDHASFFDRAIAYAYSKDTINARKDIEHAMKLDTSSRWVGYNNLGYFVRLEQKDYKGAIEMFDKSISLKPDFSYAYSNRGFAKLNLGDIKGAYQDLKKSLSLDDKNPYAFKNLALINLKEGKTSEACANLKKSLDLGYTQKYDDEVETLIKEHCR